MKLTRSALAAALLLCATVAHAQTVDITVTPASGVESVTPTITWTSSGCDSVIAFGGWTGAKAANGSETLPAIDRGASYGLTCLTSTGQAVVSWTAVTENTNGTPLTDLAGYRIYTADAATNLGSVTPIQVGPAVLTHTFDSLPQGTKYFAVTAFNSANIESALSNTASKAIEGQSATDEAAVAVQSRPKAPAASVQ